MMTRISRQEHQLALESALHALEVAPEAVSETEIAEMHSRIKAYQDDGTAAQDVRDSKRVAIRSTSLYFGAMFAFGLTVALACGVFAGKVQWYFVAMSVLLTVVLGRKSRYGDSNMEAISGARWASQRLQEALEPLSTRLVDSALGMAARNTAAAALHAQMEAKVEWLRHFQLTALAKASGIPNPLEDDGSFGSAWFGLGMVVASVALLGVIMAGVFLTGVVH